MAADSSIGLVKDGAGVEARFGDPEQRLDLKQVTVADDGLQRSVLIPREAAPSFRNDAAPLFRELLAP